MSKSFVRFKTAEQRYREARKRAKDKAERERNIGIALANICCPVCGSKKHKPTNISAYVSDEYGSSVTINKSLFTCIECGTVYDRVLLREKIIAEGEDKIKSSEGGSDEED